MGRISRSFQLVGQSYGILMQDKELMILPLISGAFIAVVVAFGLMGAFAISGGNPETMSPGGWVLLFLMYVVTYAIGIFFQAAVIAGATERMRGGDPTVSSALDAAARRWPSIILWAIVAATVGMVIRAIHDRVGFVGRFVVSLLGAAWSLATFFVVPVLVLEERSIEDSFTRSVTVFKKTWGETFIGGAGLGIAAFCAWAVLIGLTALLSMAGVWMLALFVICAGGVLLMVLFSALQGIYVASLYRYATEGPSSSGLDPDLLGHAFVPKGQQQARIT